MLTLASGKSTITGHLRYKLGGIDKLVMERVEKEAAEMNKRSFKYAWVLDKLKTERERGLTIDITHAKVETTKYSCTVIDAPGHRDFIKNMITGTFQADCAILIIDSTNGGFEAGIYMDVQTREHALLAFSLGVKQMIYCLNKMDATIPKYSKSRYEEIVRVVASLLDKIGYDTRRMEFVPISGFEGDNKIESSSKLDWYSAPTHTQAIDMIFEPKRPSDKPLRLPVHGGFKIGGIGTVAVGQIVSGSVKRGMDLTFCPLRMKSKISSVQIHDKSVQEAVAGDMVCLSVKSNVLNIGRGLVASDAKNDPARRALSFMSQVTIMNHPGQIRNGYTAVVHCHTSHFPATFYLVTKLNKLSGKVLEALPDFLKNGDAAMVEMIPTKPVVVDTFSEYPPLGRFVVRDNNQTVAVGVVKIVDKEDSRRITRSKTFLNYWIRHVMEIGYEEMIPTKPVVVDTFSEYPPLGRFVVRDNNQTVAVGVVKIVDKEDSRRITRSKTFLNYWIRHVMEIGYED